MLDLSLELNIVADVCLHICHYPIVNGFIDPLM